MKQWKKVQCELQLCIQKFRFLSNICMLTLLIASCGNSKLTNLPDEVSYTLSDKNYLNSRTPEDKYIDSELKKAHEAYEFDFSLETVNALKHERSHDLYMLLARIKTDFESKNRVFLKDIILEKILIHNFKAFHFEKKEADYFYVYPIDVYRQLKKVDSNSPTAKELLDILYEFHKLSVFYVNDSEDKNLSEKDQKIKNRLEIAYGNYAFDNPYRKMIRQIHDIKYVLKKTKVYTHPLMDYLNSDSSPPLIPPSSDIYQYQEEFPEFKNLHN